MVVPEGLRYQVMEVLRKLHVGIKRTKSIARLYVWYPSLSADTEFMVAAWNECQQTRAQSPRSKADTWPTASRWERIHIDYAEIDGRTLFILVDAVTGWIEAN